MVKLTRESGQGIAEYVLILAPLTLVIALSVAMMALMSR